MITRRGLLGAGAGGLLLSGCDRPSVRSLLESAAGLHEDSQRLIAGKQALAREFPESAMSPQFRVNGSREVADSGYRAHLAEGFSRWRLAVDGLVRRPLALPLAYLMALPQREQITRHDCVEGWSAIGKWRGARLSAILAQAAPKPNARYVVFHCADPMEEDGTGLYYESIDLDDANHEQTILAYDLNDAPLPVANGAPARLRVERQLGYKHAKYVMRLELVESFAALRGGRGGYWEDQGYQWYAGI